MTTSTHKIWPNKYPKIKQLKNAEQLFDNRRQSLTNFWTTYLHVENFLYPLQTKSTDACLGVIFKPYQWEFSLGLSGEPMTVKKPWPSSRTKLVPRLSLLCPQRDKGERAWALGWSRTIASFLTVTNTLRSRHGTFRWLPRLISNYPLPFMTTKR